MKYLGGKQRLGRHIAPVLKSVINYNKDTYKLDKYIEPFCGALGVLKNMTDIDLEIQASDYHPDLISMWQHLQQDDLDLPSSVSEDEYLYYKNEVDSPDPMKGFFGFGSSFGGRFFGAYAQKYVKGRNENFCLEAKHSLERMYPLISKVQFNCIDYTSLNPKNAFIYCDPPYQVTKFPIKYRRDVKHYDVFDNALFWETIRKWSKHNLVIISETHAPDDFIEFWHKDKLRTVCQAKKTRYKNLTADKNPQISEKLFIHETNIHLVPELNN